MGTKKILRSLYKLIGPTVFQVTGKKPWKFGYAPYKYNEIVRILGLNNFTGDRLPEGYGFRLDERVVEYPWLLSRLPEGNGRILDAGSVLNYDFLVNHNALAQKQLFISTLAPETNSFWSDCLWQNGISYVYEDFRQSCYRNEFFDYVASMSTIEHIGMDNTLLYTSDESKNENEDDAYLDAIREFKRILKPGGKLYLSVPYGKHRNYGWFQIFDAAMVDRIITEFKPSKTQEFIFQYMPDGWVRSDRESAAEADYFDIHQQKNYDEDYAAASRAVICLELVK